MNELFPDRNGNVYPMYNGFRVHLNPVLTDKKFHTRERKWAHRKMWNKAKRFNLIPYEVPSRQIIKAGDKIFMHPAMWKEIENAMTSLHKAANTFSMGMKHASESEKPQNHQRIASNALYQVEINPANLGRLYP